MLFCSFLLPYICIIALCSKHKYCCCSSMKLAFGTRTLHSRFWHGEEALQDIIGESGRCSTTCAGCYGSSRRPESLLHHQAGPNGDRALLLAVLIGASYSYPLEKGGDQVSSGGGDSGNPGFGFQAPPGGYVSVSGSQSASYPAAAAHSPYYAAAPVPAQYPGGYLPGSVQPGAPQAYSWAVEPVKHLPVETSPSSSLGVTGAPGDVDASGAISGFIPGPPAYQGGELSHVEKAYEHGNSDSETEDQGSPRRPVGPVPFPLPGPQFLPDGSVPLSSGPALYLPGGPGFGLPWYPYYDYHFLTGQYPPGTVSHFSTSYEQGKDYFHDNHYVRELPLLPGHPQVPVYPPVQQQRQ
ncbi:uncharacterized protein LOC127530257 isoform X2 [Acanthochromis polyacanthus]|uniref:uncharacterized protein LOC127530257 isoform X2 n=1 Tax=Acanthochromis polyacanthus TaxID=80966 RepID=UPI002233EF22|nr:uncharacterized protein LOC127530257 isoform X2 [Acanthochromis polyacanthus]